MNTADRLRQLAVEVGVRLAKARGDERWPHAYRSRRWRNGRWDYDYGDETPGPRGGGPASHKPEKHGTPGGGGGGAMPARHPLDKDPDEVGLIGRWMSRARVEKTLRHEPVEYIVAFHDDTAQLTRSVGVPGRVALNGQQVEALRQHGNATLVHNHVLGTAPSGSDIALAITVNAAVLRVLRPDGDAWKLTRPPGGWQTIPGDFEGFKALARELSAVVAKADAVAAAQRAAGMFRGVPDAEEALKRSWNHAIVKALSRWLGTNQRGAFLAGRPYPPLRDGRQGGDSNAGEAATNATERGGRSQKELPRDEPWRKAHPYPVRLNYLPQHEDHPAEWAAHSLAEMYGSLVVGYARMTRRLRHAIEEELGLRPSAEAGESSRRPVRRASP